MRLSDIRDDAALELLADIIEPAAEIMADKTVADYMRDGKIVKAVVPILRDHKQAITTIMAVLDGEDPADYHFNVFTLPKKLVELLNDPELLDLFQSQGQMTDSPVSGSATENTEDSGE